MVSKARHGAPNLAGICGGVIRKLHNHTQACKIVLVVSAKKGEHTEFLAHILKRNDMFVR